MLAKTFYSNQITHLEIEQKKLIQKKYILGWIRFATVAVLGLAVYLLWPFNWLFIIVCCIVWAIVFAQIIFVDVKNKRAIKYNKHLTEINALELKALENNFAHFNDGSQFVIANHPYTNDLDIFGHASLFQFCNRTTSDMGAAALANYLCNPAPLNVILNRQQAIKELASQIQWRQHFEAIGKEAKINEATQMRLNDWLNSKPIFTHNNWYKVLQYAVPLIMITTIVLNAADMITNPVRNIFLLLSAVLAFAMAKKIAPLHTQVSKMANELAVMGESIQLIEQTNFTNELLKNLKANIKLSDSYLASSELKKLKKIVERLDLRLNPVVFIPLTIILQWDIQQGMALEKWKKRNHQNINNWFDALANFEALNSFATITFNNHHWCFPTFSTTHFSLVGKSIGHPLIHPLGRVNNDININNASELMLITGSNMAGKSTYLRSIGTSIVMAMAGAPVCAAALTLYPVSLVSSMRITDNLAESTSTFYAELKKLQLIIEKVNAGETIFILLDEILRGTNSLDRHTGSVALIKQLIKHNAVGIIATHDVALANLKNDYPSNILNYYFDAQINNEELFFDYQLKAGICTSINASILMKKIGIEL
jgi:DNA mismatch repair ATPase MutS